jgi:hypothetical protein
MLAFTGASTHVRRLHKISYAEPDQRTGALFLGKVVQFTDQQYYGPISWPRVL